MRSCNAKPTSAHKQMRERDNEDASTDHEQVQNPVPQPAHKRPPQPAQIIVNSERSRGKGGITATLQ